MSDVKLYVYDLSRGMAKRMSLMLTGKQIDGIWHTSVVAYGREIFFGQGILEARPGTTHHGQPVQVLDCGRTEIDESTFNEYIGSLQEMYTPQAYHLIEFNCNHFTADVVGFLTGAEIPKWISGLPAEFLFTPFGQAMKPQIDAMFNRTAPSEHPVNSPSSAAPGPSASSAPSVSGTSPPLAAAASLLNAVASSATAGPSTVAPKPTAETSPLTLVSSLTNFNSILKQYPAVVVNFTNTPSCPPCRVIKPIYETTAQDYATSHGPKGARFLEVELSVGEGRDIAGRNGVSATPTFGFFRNGKKVDELRGANKRELEVKVEQFLEETWPSHPHRKVYLPSLEHLPINPTSSSNVPNFAALLTKLESFGGPTTDIAFIKSAIVPLLEGKSTLNDEQLQSTLSNWTKVTDRQVKSLKPEQTFPMIDLWRVGLLNPRLSALIALNMNSHASDPIPPLLLLAADTLKAQGTATPKPFLLTTLRLLTNAIAVLPLANLLLASHADTVLKVVVDSLLHPDNAVRTAAAGVAFNLSTVRHRDAKERGASTDEGDEKEWEVELVSALVEAIGREEDEDVAHRLLASLGLAVFLAPGFSESLKPLLDVLEAKKSIEGRIKLYKRKEVKKLAEDVIKAC